MTEVVPFLFLGRQSFSDLVLRGQCSAWDLLILNRLWPGLRGMTSLARAVYRPLRSEKVRSSFLMWSGLTRFPIAVHPIERGRLDRKAPSTFAACVFIPEEIEL